MAALIPVAEAWARIARHAPAMSAESAPLAEAAGRVLAHDLATRVTQPPFPASAMDGYAVRFADMAPGTRLTVTGESPAGAAFAGTVGPGEAVRIFTGGVVPPGADHVVIQEEVARESDTIVIACPQDRPDNIRAAGVDFHKGDIVLRAGDALTGARLALAAAANVATLEVARRPRVAIIASGDELAAPGSALQPGQIVGSTSYGLAALVAEWGGAPVLAGTASDTIPAIHAILDAAQDADIIAPLGGASVGDRDVMREAFAQRGFDLKFEKIAVRPGKPTWFGVDPAGRRVLGLPGNPASALVCAHLFLKPLLWAATGRNAADAVRFLPARLGQAAPANGARETWLRARLTPRADGALEVTPFPRQDSSLLTPFASADCLLRRAADAPAARAGDAAEILLLHGLRL